MSFYGLMILFLFYEEFLCAHLRRRVSENQEVSVLHDAQHQSEWTDVPGTLIDGNTGNESLVNPGSDSGFHSCDFVASDHSKLVPNSEKGMGLTDSAVVFGNTVAVGPAGDGGGIDTTIVSGIVGQEKSKTDQPLVSNTTSSKDISVNVQVSAGAQPALITQITLSRYCSVASPQAISGCSLAPFHQCAIV